jgi:hypothetical protein
LKGSQERLLLAKEKNANGISLFDSGDLEKYKVLGKKLGGI